MHARAGMAHQLENGVQRNGFCNDGHAGQTQTRGNGAAVGNAAAQAWVLRAQSHAVAKGFGVLHRAQHHHGVHDGFRRLRKADAAGFCEFSHFG